MSTTIPMPQLGETITEGTILRWAKEVGDTVALGEIVLEISTDKVDTEVPSPVAGVILEILVEEGATVEVGTDLCVVGDGDGEAAQATTAAREEPPSTEGGTCPAGFGGAVASFPAHRLSSGAKGPEQATVSRGPPVGAAARGGCGPDRGQRGGGKGNPPGC